MWQVQYLVKWKGCRQCLQLTSDFYLAFTPPRLPSHWILCNAFQLLHYQRLLTLRWCFKKPSRFGISYDFRKLFRINEKVTILATFLMHFLGPTLSTKTYENLLLVLFEACWGPKLCTSMCRVLAFPVGPFQGLSAYTNQSPANKTN